MTAPTPTERLGRSGGTVLTLSCTYAGRHCDDHCGWHGSKPAPLVPSDCASTTAQGARIRNLAASSDAARQPRIPSFDVASCFC